MFIYFLIVFLLLLTSLNIKNRLTPRSVLGAEVETGSSEDFWQDFVTENPSYIPGWIELGRLDKAEVIDPNFVTNP